MNKYRILRDQLLATGEGEMKCFGNSMLPKLPNPCTNLYREQTNYEKGDIVFCKVNGRFIDAHLITKIGKDGRYMIANNHGHENGWTRTIYGKVVRATDESGNIKFFD